MQVPGKTSAPGAAILLIFLLLTGLAGVAHGQKESIAVLDFQALGATPTEALGVSDRFREELLRTGKFIVVERNMIKDILDEQAFQQLGCVTQECAVKIGEILGVRRLISGKVTKFSPGVWQVNALMVDVETAETLRAESVRHRGDIFTLLDVTITELAAKMARLAEMPKEEMDKFATFMEQSQYEDELSSWRWKFWPIVIGASAFVLLAYGEGENVKESNSRQNQLAAQTGSVSNQAEFDALLASIRAEQENGEQAEQNAQLYFLAAAGVAAWAYFVYDGAPESPNVTLVPAPVPGGRFPGPGLALIWRW